MDEVKIIHTEDWVTAGDAEMDRMISFFLQLTVKCQLYTISQSNIDFNRYYSEETYSKNAINTIFFVKFNYVRLFLDIHTLIK